jgi:DNA helicase IV
MYNHSLYGYLRTAVRELDLTDNITIATKDKFFWDMARLHGIRPYGEEYDEKYTILLDQLLSQKIERTYDIVIVDEVQDLRKQEWQLIEKLAKRITSLGDFDQGIYQTNLSKSDVIRNTLSQRLREIFRFTRSISKLAEKFSRSGSTLTDKVKKADNKVPQKFEVNPGEVHNKIGEILSGLRNNRERIGVLCPDSHQLSSLSAYLHNRGIDHAYYEENKELREHDFGSNTPILLKSFSAKGLEFEHVILFGFEDDVTSIHRLRNQGRLNDVIYVSITRTNSNLYFVNTRNTVAQLRDLEIEQREVKPVTSIWDD